MTSIINKKEGIENYATCELIAHSKTLLKQHMVSSDLEDGFAQVAATSQSRKWKESKSKLSGLWICILLVQLYWLSVEIE